MANFLVKSLHSLSIAFKNNKRYATSLLFYATPVIFSKKDINFTLGPLTLVGKETERRFVNKSYPARSLMYTDELQS